MRRRIGLPVAVVLLAGTWPVRAQDDGPAGRPARRPDGPWFGVPLPPGLERVARFLAAFLEGVSGATRAQVGLPR